MTPEEMQSEIEYLREEWRTVCLIATEPHTTPVQPPGTIDRDRKPTTRKASEDEIGSLINEYDN